MTGPEALRIILEAASKRGAYCQYVAEIENAAGYSRKFGKEAIRIEEAIAHIETYGVRP